MAVSLTPTPPILFSSPFFSSAIATRGNYSSRLPLQASPRPCFPHVQASPVAAKSTPSSSIEQETTDVDYDDVAPKTLSSYGPSLWGDYFLNYEPKPLQRSEKWMSARADKLKEDVDMLFKSCNCMVERITLLDTVQHLGIDHHFKKHVDTTLSQIFEGEFNISSLHQVALRFRLLREHGLWVSSAHLLIHAEPSLEQAISFSRHHLQLMRDTLKSPLVEQVKRALHMPFSRTFKRMETLRYISEYKHEEGHNPTLLELAKLDFNLL
ncbi:unnamed protein product [Triticum turgidum subsp. durum]|uniref:Terpene synthase N-terminal domain-containing protein n=1 Tax=Triticum turgidum subsp. durum TaxID=4567 RepID=A0A9R1NLT5_TRITD|nr:unnamed protein product [Triticum turgidum subsp. durum]